MIKWQWELFDHWMVDNNHRVIFKPRESGAHLVDVTIDSSHIEEVVKEVLREEWTTRELMAYLNNRIAVK